MRTLELLTRRALVGIGLADGHLQHRVRRGELIRIAPATYADVTQWRALEPMEQHRMRVIAMQRRMGAHVITSHFAAASLWAIRLLGRWPTYVDVTIERSSGGRSSGGIKRHGTGTDGVAITMLDGYPVTTPAQTVVDLARELPFADAVVAMDSVLSRRRRAALATKAELLERAAASEGKRGWRRALAAASFATSLSDSPQESWSRVLIHQLGFPRPELQRRFGLPDGTIYETDFYWSDFDHVGECDGRGKYTDPQYLEGRSPGDVVVAEKNRENALRRVVHGFSRWEPRDLVAPSRLYDILVDAGLPTRMPRPPA